MLLELVQVQVLEQEQGLLQVQQGHGQVQVILSLASLFFFFGFWFLTLKTGLLGLTALTGPQLSLIWPLACSVTHLPELSGPQHVRGISRNTVETLVSPCCISIIYNSAFSEMCIWRTKRYSFCQTLTRLISYTYTTPKKKIKVTKIQTIDLN